MDDARINPTVAIACGGTGGHLFPGLAVAERLRVLGCRIILLISPKEIDQVAVKNAADVKVVTLPAVGLTRGKVLQFAMGFVKSYRAARKLFACHRPVAALAMGGFTSAPPVLAAKQSGAATFLHESNSIPGRANRWLSHFGVQAFVGFSSARVRLSGRSIITGTPVRSEFGRTSAYVCRKKLGFDPEKPVLLTMGGSQGASAINSLITASLPILVKQCPELQFFHLTGPVDVKEVSEAYARCGAKAQVHAFFSDMPAALGSATIVISRAGASSLAEIAAVRVPSVLIPFPAAVDNHQYFNALAFADTGAAVLLEQRSATPNSFLSVLSPLLEASGKRQAMAASLNQWHAPAAAEKIACAIMEAIPLPQEAFRTAKPPAQTVNPRPSALA